MMFTPGLHSGVTLNTGPYCLRQCCAALGKDIRSTSSRLPMSHTGGGPAGGTASLLTNRSSALMLWLAGFGPLAVTKVSCQPPAWASSCADPSSVGRALRTSNNDYTGWCR